MVSKTISALAIGLACYVADVAALTQCVVPSKWACSNGTACDSPAIQQVFARCSKDSEIIFSEGVNYNVCTPISQTNLSNVVVRHLGNLHIPEDIPYVQNQVANNSGNYWWTLKGKDVSWIGSPDVNNGWFKSHGQIWYDTNAETPDATGLANRPHLFLFQITNGFGQYWKSSKPIMINFILKGSNITVLDTVIDAVSSTSAFPFNTDGFDVGATDVTIERSTIYNGDDACAVGSGAHNVVFRDATIGYQTHGMSIGSLKTGANVSNILFEDVTVATGLYAARFKSWANNTGIAQNITWRNIKTYNVSVPIFVTQVYYNQVTGSAAEGPVTSAVTMKDFTWENISGSINSLQYGDGSCASDPCWYDAGLPTNLDHSQALVITCATSDSCNNFKVSNVNLYPTSGAPTTQLCEGVYAANNPDFGLTCANSVVPVAWAPTA